MEIKALVADNSAKVRKNIIRSLNELGVRDVVEATDTDQAKELLEQRAFDIVFAEWQGQMGDVEELVKSVRQFDAEVPIIVTAPQSKDMAEKNWPTASTYLTMPFTTEQLRKTVSEYVPSIAG
jgi:DNA-binding NtrC family response regulator